MSFQVFASADGGRKWYLVGDYLERSEADSHADLCDLLFWLCCVVVKFEYLRLTSDV